jgi:hypothetical protein
VVPDLGRPTRRVRVGGLHLLRLRRTHELANASEATRPPTSAPASPRLATTSAPADPRLAQIELARAAREDPARRPTRTTPSVS